MTDISSHELSPAEALPERLGPYEIRGELGSGGLGAVYRAWDERLAREVALKVLAPGSQGPLATLADLEREARLLASLSHPCILSIFDIGEEDGRRYIATELLEGLDLRRRMGGRPLPWRTAAAIVLEAAKGLAAAHARGVVHLDLKPENIFLLAQGGVKLLDFGLARRAPELPTGGAARAPDSATEPRELVGTVVYMSPEQLAGGPLDHRSDIFSLGSVLYEVLTGQAPFKRHTILRTADAIANEHPPAMPKGGPAVPPGLVRIMRRCLSKDPAQRFQSAYDLAFALNEQLALPATPPRPTQWPLKLCYFLAGAAAALTLLLLARLLS